MRMMKKREEREKKKKKKPKGGAQSEFWAKVRVLRQDMFINPPPALRMGRLRHLRHWTIHRAWQLYRRHVKEAFVTERQRIYAGMYWACEELRRTQWPANRSEGYLYRTSQEKKGLWKTPSVVPIEYTRYQTETPPLVPWNHDWKRM
ncbi:hypothetical protein CDD81_3440 [Ophiocordyceps australis]|uniref:Uncharacterized protein n=1 Tax=Ophiocordyceps australis TaxID=1399860 RepID=A0A2C5YCP4_9HYPO|nr:hypothetical protein CDD81_3440 [Ophiocordyceps australis]